MMQCQQSQVADALGFVVAIVRENDVDLANFLEFLCSQIKSRGYFIETPFLTTPQELTESFCNNLVRQMMNSSCKDAYVLLIGSGVDTVPIRKAQSLLTERLTHKNTIIVVLIGGTPTS